MDEIIQLSIIIVNYKNQRLITQCVKSIIDIELELNYEIIVVDNNSEDETENVLREMYPTLIWIQMANNAGFSKANNAGVRYAKGKWLLFLNPDTLFIEPVLQKCINVMNSNPRIGVLGCQLLNRDKSLQYSYHDGDNVFLKLWRRTALAIRFFRGSQENEKSMSMIKDNHKTSHFTKWLTGAFLLFRKEEFIKKNFFWDEDFFMYWEDVELCNRVRKSKLQNYYFADVSIIHIGGSGFNVPVERFNALEANKLLYIKKKHGKFAVYFYKKLFRLELKIELGLLKNKKIDINSVPYFMKEIEYYGIK